MKKSELIAMVMEKSSLTKAQVEVAFNATFDSIAELLAKQDSMLIPDFGKFESKKRNARKGRNPSTGKEMNIPASMVVNFKSSSQLKSLVNVKGAPSYG